MQCAEFLWLNSVADSSVTLVSELFYKKNQLDSLWTD